MSQLIGNPPLSPVDPVTEILHGVPVTDPFRWLENHNSPETRAWIKEQTNYAREYLDGITERSQIRDRVRELLDVETYDSFVKTGNRYFFRKRAPGSEQPSIYFREGATGEDRMLVDPATRGTGDYTAVKPLRVSPDGSLLLYEVKQGGERMSAFEILDVTGRRRLPDALPRGYLRGFAFAPDAKSFYYVHEAADSQRPFYRAAYQHVLGASFETDREIFFAGEDQKLRLVLLSSARTLGLLVCRFSDLTYTDFYIWSIGGTGPAIPVLCEADYLFSPQLLPGRILAVIDQNAPNRKIVEVQPRKNQNPLYFDLVAESDAPIRDSLVTANRIVVLYARGASSEIVVFDGLGKRAVQIPCNRANTLRIVAGNLSDNEILFERESFTRPIETVRCDLSSSEISTWAQRAVPFDSSSYAHIEASFPSKDGTAIPISIVGRPDLLAEGAHPVVMTSYGGYGIPMTPQFSAFVAFLIERGCLFALPNIRGGSEFGAVWHRAAKRRKRQVAFDDFLAAAQWLIQTGRTAPEKLAIFGGSNSGLLVGAAMTQRPDLFCAVLCMVPMLDMLRYHLFDNAHVWKDEFGTADDLEDFRSLLGYSPYHAVRDHTAYPATMIVSGDADQNCNPLHARKMAARLQTANSARTPIFMDYNPSRGHSPVLPLRERVNALADRLAFFCDQLGLVA